MNNQNSRKTTFREVGYISDEVRDEIGRFEREFPEEFSLLADANTLAMKFTEAMSPVSSIKRELAVMLLLRFCQSLQSCYLLLAHGINADANTLIRNMFESYLALAVLTKDEEQFKKMVECDEKSFKNRLHKAFRDFPSINTQYKKFSEVFERSHAEREKLNCKGVKSLQASSLYEITKDDELSQASYLKYSYLSNMYSHVSISSLLLHRSVERYKSYLDFSSINPVELRSAIRYAVDAVIIFLLKLDVEFLQSKHATFVRDLEAKAYQLFKANGSAVHVDDLEEYLRRTGDIE